MGESPGAPPLTWRGGPALPSRESGAAAAGPGEHKGERPPPYRELPGGRRVFIARCSPCKAATWFGIWGGFFFLFFFLICYFWHGICKSPPVGGGQREEESGIAELESFGVGHYIMPRSALRRWEPWGDIPEGRRREGLSRGTFLQFGFFSSFFPAELCIFLPRCTL